jgi:hypothetical protein
MNSPKFAPGIAYAVSQVELLLDRWQKRIVEEPAAPTHGDLFKLLLVETQELLYILQRTLSVVDPKVSIIFRHSNALPPEVKTAKTKPQPRPKSPLSPSKDPKQEQPATPSVAKPPSEMKPAWVLLGFESKESYFAFQTFVQQYVTFTVEMIEITLGLTSLPQMPADLPVLNERLQRTVYVLSLRVHKLMLAMYKMFPSALELPRSSLFDKNYMLNGILNAQGLSEQEAWAEYLMQTTYESETAKLLVDGGISNKTVKQISAKSKTIKDCVDTRILKLIDEANVHFGLFIQSPVLKQVMQRLPLAAEVTAAMFKQSFDFEFGPDILTAARWLSFRQLVSGRQQEMATLQLVDLVNATDFLSMHALLSAFEQDCLALCVDAVRKENARNYSHHTRSIGLSQLKESLQGQHLLKQVSFPEMGQRTLFLRT